MVSKSKCRNRKGDPMMYGVPGQYQGGETKRTTYNVRNAFSGPWQNLSADFCGPLDTGEYLMVIIDEYSRYPVVEIVKSVSANSIIPVIDKVLSVFGVPVVIKTDNGSPFSSHQFNKYSKHMGFIHRKITPLWPRANAQAESFNKPLMKSVRCAKLEGKNWKEEIFKFLRQYRATPHTVTGYSPFRFLFQREAKTRLPDAVVTNENRFVDKKQGRMMKRVNHTKITKIGQ